jgi:hypothetical protein
MLHLNAFDHIGHSLSSSLMDVAINNVTCKKHQFDNSRGVKGSTTFGGVALKLMTQLATLGAIEIGLVGKLTIGSINTVTVIGGYYQ